MNGLVTSKDVKPEPVPSLLWWIHDFFLDGKNKFRLKGPKLNFKKGSAGAKVHKI